MEHKGYAFDWYTFEHELYPILIKALKTSKLQEIIQFIERNQTQLTDPYEGKPLDDHWQSLLINRDAQEYGDYALTKYYAAGEPAGIGDTWMALSEQLPAKVAQTLLGETIGPRHNLFDPGRMGSYFQRPEQVYISLEILVSLSLPEIDEFRELLSRCVTKNLGVYITF